MELLSLLLVLVAGYAVAGLLYQRYFRNRLPELPSPPEESATVEPERSEAIADDGVLCPACGLANDAVYARCFNCASPIPGG